MTARPNDSRVLRNLKPEEDLGSQSQVRMLRIVASNRLVKSPA